MAAAMAAVLVPQPAAAQARTGGPVLRARGQTPPPVVPVAPAAAGAPVAVYQSPNAAQTLNDLQRLLDQYPPNLRQILQLDPSLLDQPDYLAPYPALAAFLQQHPEIARNPSFFFGGAFIRRDRDPKSASIDMAESVLGGLAAFTAGMVVLGVVVTLLRDVIAYRRWLRQSRAQAEANAKVLDRLSSNEDLLAYLQTPAGASFLQAAPNVFDNRGSGGTPMSRILWSVQAGIVVAALGIGLRIAGNSVMAELAPGFHVAGIIAITVGVGFVLAAAVAYALTLQMRPTLEKS